MKPLRSDDRLEIAIRHPKLFSDDAREGRSRRFIRTLLLLMGALFVLAYGAWFANMRENAAASAGQAPDIRSHVGAPATDSTTYLSAQRTPFRPATVMTDAPRDRIYKCVGKSGAATFQQVPCATGLKTDRVITYVPRAEPAGAQRYPAAPVVSQSLQYSVPTISSNYVAPKAECKAAEIWADDRRRQLGIHATFEDLRFLQDYVYERCK